MVYVVFSITIMSHRAYAVDSFFIQGKKKKRQTLAAEKASDNSVWIPRKSNKNIQEIQNGILQILYQF